MQSNLMMPASGEPLAAPQPDVAPPAGRGMPQWVRLLFSSNLTIAGVALFIVIVLVAIFAPLLTPYGPIDMIGPLGGAPSRAHPFGTNDAGQDIFTQVVYGARYTLVVGLASGVAITVLATVVGMTAAYVGRWLDDLFSMIMNVFLVVPQLPLLVVIAAYVPLKGNNIAGSALIMITVITVTGGGWGGRVIRSQTLTLRSRDFVQAAIVAGASKRRVIFGEIMPNMISLLANTVIMSSMGAILTEAALDYLGIGSINQVTWGTMLNRAQANSTLFSGEWWCFVFPGLAIALTVMAMILMNYGVDLISNPRLRIIKAPEEEAAEAPPSTGRVEAAS
jgi:peptide/nickel transport system permease protein